MAVSGAGGNPGQAVVEASDRSDAYGPALLPPPGQLGPLAGLIADPAVEEIWWNDPGRVFVARRGRTELTTAVMTAEEAQAVVERLLRHSGRRVDRSTPFVDAPLADGSRLHVVIPPVTACHWAVNIRRFVLRPTGVADLVSGGLLPQPAADLLVSALAGGATVVVSGATQAGKTTTLNALLAAVPSHERIVSCEEVAEVRPPHPDWVALQSRAAGLDGEGEIPLRALVREALRMRPTRIVVGEVRQAEALDLLLAANCGVPAMATIHANSCAEAVLKLCTLPLLAGPNISVDFVVATVASCVDLVVQLRLAPDGRRSVAEIAELTGEVDSGRPVCRTLWRPGAEGWSA